MRYRVLIIALFFTVGIISICFSNPVWPLNTEHQMTSSFGEYRAGHFHAGIDLRTPDGEGMPIIAPYKGSIIRARESPWGYGKVIYYKMFDGYTAVFAHLSSFADTLAKKIYSEKKKLKKSAVELWFRGNEFIFDAGDTIAYSGSSGAGSAHLHFELRKGIDNAINPALRGYITEDKKSPHIENIYFIPESDGAHIRGEFSPVRIPVAFDNSIDKNRPIYAYGDFSIAIDAFDLESEKNPNRFGVYKITLLVNDIPVYYYSADSFLYLKTRQVGLLYDLSLQNELKLEKPPFILKKPENADVELISPTPDGAGIFRTDQDTIRFVIKTNDFVGNKCEVSFSVIKSTFPILPPINVIEKNKKTIIASQMQAEDTIGLILEYYIPIGKNKPIRGRMPTDGNPNELGDGISFIQITKSDFKNPIWFWRKGINSEPTIEIEVVAVRQMRIIATFPETLAGSPILIRDGDSLPCETVDGRTCSFRIFDPVPDGEFTLLWTGGSCQISPRIWRAEEGESKKLTDERWKLDFPKGSIFSPFILRDTSFIGNDGKKSIRIEPEGILLKSFAKLSLDTVGSGASLQKLCLVRLWNDKKIFLSNQIDKGGRLFANINTFGDFSTELDTIPPFLKLNIKKGAQISKTLSASLWDDLSGFSVDVLPDNYIDGAWFPIDYDPEKRGFTVNIENLLPGTHEWVVHAIDLAGNAISDSVEFIKK